MVAQTGEREAQESAEAAWLGEGPDWRLSVQLCLEDCPAHHCYRNSRILWREEESGAMMTDTETARLREAPTFSRPFLSYFPTICIPILRNFHIDSQLFLPDSISSPYHRHPLPIFCLARSQQHERRAPLSSRSASPRSSASVRFHRQAELRIQGCHVRE